MGMENSMTNGGGGSGGGAVDSVFGRTGVVIAQANDYSASQVTYASSDPIVSATNVQGAIDQTIAAINGKVSGPKTSTVGAIASFGDISGDTLLSNFNWQILSNQLVGNDAGISVGSPLLNVSVSSSIPAVQINTAEDATALQINMTSATDYLTAISLNAPTSPNASFISASNYVDTVFSVGNSGEIVGKKLVVAYASSIAAPYQLEEYESNNVLTDFGAAVKYGYRLPAGVLGAIYSFNVTSAFGLRVIASGSDTIRIAAVQSAAGGYAESVTVGSFITFIFNGVQWIATNSAGIWTLT